MKWLRELSGYAAASAGALAVDASILWLLVRAADVNYLLAACASFTCGAFVAYWLSVRLAFRQHRLRNRHAEFVCFFAIGLLGLSINAGVMYLAVQLLSLHLLLAKGVAAGFTFSFNFVARRQALFVPRTPQGASQ